MAKIYLNKEKPIIKKMRKKGSLYSIIFQIHDIDDGDNWFIDCLTVKTKTGEIINSSCIIEKDMPIWHNGFINRKYYLIT